MKRKTKQQVSSTYAESVVKKSGSPCVESSRGYIRDAFVAGAVWQSAQTRRRAVGKT